MKNLYYSIPIIIFLIITGGVSKEAVNLSFIKLCLKPPLANATSDKLQKEIEKWVHIANTQMNLPKLVDDETLIVNVTARRGGVAYHHKLVHYNIKDINLDKLKRIIRTNVKNNVCNSSDMRSALKLGMSFTFSYVDKDGNFLEETTIKQGDCNY